MLTATYCFVALSVEHRIAGRLLSKLQEDLQSRNWRQRKKAEPHCAEALVSMLLRFDEFFHSRKVEKYMIPMLQRVTIDLDPLLKDLHSMSAEARNILDEEHACLQKLEGRDKLRIGECFDSVSRYCECMQKRLNREEEELFCNAQRILSLDEWFDIAAGCLSHDATKEAAWTKEYGTC